MPIVGNLSPSLISSIMYGIISLSHTHTHIYIRFEVCYICRNGNKSIHLLARYAQGVEHYFTEEAFGHKPNP